MIYIIVISLMLGAIWFLIHLHNKKKTEIQNMSDAELFEPIRPIVSPRNYSENFTQSFRPNVPQRFPSPPARSPQRSSLSSSSSFRDEDDSYTRKRYDQSDDYSSSFLFDSFSNSCSDSSSSYSCDSSSSDSCSCSD